MTQEENMIIQAKIKAILEFWNPLWSWHDQEDAISPLEVKAYSRFAAGIPYPDTGAHEVRIAWFVANGWKDPILIDVGIPGFSNFYVDDGNHRLAAALIRGDETITANIQGAMSLIEEIQN